MSDIQNYFLKQESTRAAKERLNYASTALDLARINERLAELKSQHEPLSTLLNRPLSERDRLYAAAFYVVVGRLPSGYEEEAPT